MTPAIDERGEAAPAQFVLNASCASAPGQVAAIVRLLEARSCYVCEFDVFDDASTRRFFVRAVFRSGSPRLDLAELRGAFAEVAAAHAMQCTLHDLGQPVRVLILVSRLDHCLADLLFRWRMKELRMEVTGVVSNHPDLQPLAAGYGLPFHHLPVDAGSKESQERRLIELVERTGTELVVLARYMQILSPHTSRLLAGRAINIHHSFLPGFKGAKPYHQAHARGVKLIGATAHFVTDDLDEGPIIEQVVERVNHSFDPERLASTGRDMECLALARQRATRGDGSRSSIGQVIHRGPAPACCMAACCVEAARRAIRVQ